jgi:hypothetical protein
VRGADARCVAMLEAMKDVVKDYVTPPGKALERDLQLEVLSACLLLSLWPRCSTLPPRLESAVSLSSPPFHSFSSFAFISLPPRYNHRDIERKQPCALQFVPCASPLCQPLDPSTWQRVCLQCAPIGGPKLPVFERLPSPQRVDGQCQAVSEGHCGCAGTRPIGRKSQIKG